MRSAAVKAAEERQAHLPLAVARSPWLRRPAAAGVAAAPAPAVYLLLADGEADESLADVARDALEQNDVKFTTITAEVHPPDALLPCRGRVCCLRALG